MYIPEEAKLKVVEDVKIPSMSELALQFGLRPSAGTPDNTDPDHFQTPDNLHDSSPAERQNRAEMAQISKIEAEIAAATSEAEKAAESAKESKIEASKESKESKESDDDKKNA